MPHDVQDTIQDILKIEKDKIIRPSYGDTSLKYWEPEYYEIIKKLQFIYKYIDYVPVSVNTAIKQNIDSIHQTLLTCSNETDNVYVAYRNNYIDQIRYDFDFVKQQFIFYAVASLEQNGLIGSNIDFSEEIKSKRNELNDLFNTTVKKIEEKTNNIVKQITDKAELIEKSVRQTAQGISVEVAQKQFGEGADHNKTNVWIWGTISSILIGIFVYFLYYLLSKELPEIWTWQMIYYSVLRITALGFLSMLLAFSLKMLKAHLHMHQHNLHRQRIANSMAAFVESAMNNEQRDIILSRLVDSVSAFGNSGIINNDDDNASRVTVDNITRTLNAVKGHE